MRSGGEKDAHQGPPIRSAPPASLQIRAFRAFFSIIQLKTGAFKKRMYYKTGYLC